MSWSRHAKIAFIGSHGIRKTTAAHGFASVIQRAGRSVEYGREVVRDNPLGFNESATGAAQLWVLVSQIRQELELAPKADVLVLDRGVMDNFAYYLRACRGEDLFDIAPLVRRWSETYDLVVRLLPDIELRADGVRSTNDTFRDEIEAILDDRLPNLVAQDRRLSVPASEVTDAYDWWPIAALLASRVGQPLLADGVAAHSARRPAPRPRATPARPEDQLVLDLGPGGTPGAPTGNRPVGA